MEGWNHHIIAPPINQASQSRPQAKKKEDLKLIRYLRKRYGGQVAEKVKHPLAKSPALCYILGASIPLRGF